MSEQPVIQCATCKYYSINVKDFDLNYCMWIGKLPFWATVVSRDHAEYTKSTDGANCFAW